MGLPVGQRKHLDKIESSLRASDPRLASLFTIFTRLSEDEEMPALEQLRASAVHLWLWLRFRRTAFGRWLGTSAGARVRTVLFGGGMPGSHRCLAAARVVGTSQLNPKSREKALACNPVLWSRGLVGK